MNRLIVALFATVALAGATRADDAVLVKDYLVLDKDAAVKAGVYRVADSGDDGALRIAGDGITIDFQGAELVGGADDATPDTYSGRGIVIRGLSVTLKNAKVRGYKVGIYAEGSPGLKLVNCDVSRNYRQRLKSTPEREDLSDWIYGHENDANEWLRYGAGIYLWRCPRTTVRECRARNGQNGLCLVQCDDSVVIDNDMSFMSGWGLAMWRTSRCDVSHNKFDWCIRGYSHGVYSRGQDSAGILVYEQCSDNVLAYNSATHSGDGFFLYAGNETLKESGKGGCNRNLVYRNDFSHAAANGIEATFSDGNVFIQNVLDECEHGIWAGYSYNTVIAENVITHCRQGVSIEHGSRNWIAMNLFRNDEAGVHLWWDEDKDLLESRFCQDQDGCPSRKNAIIRNVFRDNETALRLTADQGSAVEENRVTGGKTTLRISGNVEGLHGTLAESDRQRVAQQDVSGKVELDFEAFEPPDPPPPWESRYPKLAQRLGARKVFMRPPDADAPPWTRELVPWVKAESKLPHGRRYIVIDEWGPWDFSDARGKTPSTRGALGD